MYDALITLVQWTLTMTCVGLAALAITPLLRRRYASWGVYALWVVILAGFLIPLKLPARESAVTVQVPSVIREPIALRTVTQKETVSAAQAAVPTIQTLQEEKNGLDIPTLTPAQAVFGIYVVGALILLLEKIVRHLRFMRTVRRWSIPVEDGETLAAFERAKRDVDVRKGPRIAYCEAVESPMLAGIIHPRILLPVDVPKGDALILILRHELVHYRRGDLIVKLFSLVAIVVHWFNPVVHLANRMSNVYCELSCDAQAMRAATLDERALYSRTILSALRRRPVDASTLTTNFRTDKKTLKRRLIQIMDMHVKKRGWAFALCAALLTLVVGTGFALADTQTTQTWDVTPMTKDEMLAIYQESFERMNTTSEIYYNEDAIIGADELETWLADFNKRYEQENGRDHKDDLIVSTTPGAHDMPYEEALAYAKQLIMDKYGTPEEELDAMGVYPRFMDYIYWEDESEWEFFFTSLKDCDIDEDHDYPGAGEYRVHFGAQSKEVLLCLWYIDDFWPYAQRTWDAGKHDIVYEQAQKVSFYLQDLESQAHFTQLLTDAGYDMSKRPDVLSGVELDMMFADPADSVLLNEDADVQRAMAALEAQYGLSAQTLDAHNFVAYPLEMATGTKDYCIVFNYELEYQRDTAEGADTWLTQINHYPRNLGSFLVSLDIYTGELVGIEHKLRDANVQDAPDAKLLERNNWTAEDLQEFDALCARITEATASLETNYYQDEVAFATLMREAGGDATIYSAREPAEDELTYEQVAEIAHKAVMEKENLTQEEYDGLYQDGECYFDSSYPSYEMYIFTKIPAQTQEECRDYYVQIDAKSGEILRIEIVQGNG